MITDMTERSHIGPDLRIEMLEPYWHQYFEYRDQGADLHQIIEDELSVEIEAARQKARPFLDAQQAISRVLTRLGPGATFHRQFNECFPDFRANQVLGMQLYALVAADEDTWVYTPIQHAGHMYSHSSYFIPRRP